jgi:hypothetical protein
VKSVRFEDLGMLAFSPDFAQVVANDDAFGTELGTVRAFIKGREVLVHSVCCQIRKIPSWKVVGIQIK